jgi:DNA-binding NtrC family response regulator
VTLSSLDDNLAGSELFGHVMGAFTDARSARAGLFVSAAGGTLFLDELGKASRAVQQKLLHVIEYGELRPVGSDRDIRINVRIVAAANESLERLVDQGEFLSDLLARLSVFTVRVPSLRERRADIPPLVDHYLRIHAARLGLPTPSVEPDLLRGMQAADWPNNLRQLDATVHRLLLEADGAGVICLRHCVGPLSSLYPHSRREQWVTATEASDAIATAGTISGAAKLLGVHRTTVYRASRRVS